MTLRPSIATLYKSAALAAQHLPRAVTSGVVTLGATAASMLAGDRRVIVERNLERAGGHVLSEGEKRRAVARTFSSYGRYYLDSFRLPALDAGQIDDGFEYHGFEHITDAIATGTGPILVLPHLGGWEWAAFWLTKVNNIKVTAIVEPLDPPELFDWFRSFRESLGMKVIAVGPDAGPAIIEAVNNGEVVCLLSDRIVADAAAVPVEFFGERTLLPAGPATIALRTGARLLPVAVYFRGDKHVAEVRPPVSATRAGSFRTDVERVTQSLANELERFIRAAPEQWHVLQPGWPSDFRALGRPLPERMQKLL